MTRAERTKPTTMAKAETSNAAGAPAEYVVIGKDVLELLSSAMYVDPLTIFREYIQNAADAIDHARELGVLGDGAAGEVAVTFDTVQRRIMIRDNGAGIPIAEAGRRLLSIGGSTKRGTRARGFRGVGRLAGLAYCRQLIFRTRAAGDDQVFELRWDCMKLKAALREVGQDDDLPGVIDRIVAMGRIAPGEFPEHFFEVEMLEVVRHHRQDALLNEDLVGQYLSEVAPVPFDVSFRHSPAIVDHIAPHVRTGDLDITINKGRALRRRHRDTFPVSDTVADEVGDLELLTFEGRDGGVAAVGWLVHHAYLGALPDRAGVKGLRLRAGNVQVGGAHLLEEAFPEPRFNSWTIGELHVVDPRLVPNARRDHFEQNVHFADLAAQVQPLARAIAKRCRAASIERNQAKRAQALVAALAPEMKAVAARRPDLAAQVAQCARSLKAVAAQVGRSGAGDPAVAALTDLLTTLEATAALSPREQVEAYLKGLLDAGALTKDDLKAITGGLRKAPS